MVKYIFPTLKKTSKLLPLTFVSMGLCAVMGLPTLAADEVYHGDFCTFQGANLNQIDHSPQYGIGNGASTRLTVVCPIIHPIIASVKEVDVFVYNRNPSASISCTLYGLDLDGTKIWTATGSNSLLGKQFISIHPPQNQGVNSMSLLCSLPGLSNNGASYLTTYRVITP